MKQTVGKVPVEFLIGAVKCLTTIAMYQLLRTIIVNGEIIDVICAAFEVNICLKRSNGSESQIPISISVTKLETSKLKPINYHLPVDVFNNE